MACNALIVRGSPDRNRDGGKLFEGENSMIGFYNLTGVHISLWFFRIEIIRPIIRILILVRIIMLFCRSPTGNINTPSAV